MFFLLQKAKCQWRHIVNVAVAYSIIISPSHSVIARQLFTLTRISSHFNLVAWDLITSLPVANRTMATQSGYASFCQSPLYLVSHPNILITQTDSNRKTHYVKYVCVNQQPDIYFKDATHAENQLAIWFNIYIIKRNACLPDPELSCVFLHWIFAQECDVWQLLAVKGKKVTFAWVCLQ